MALILMNPQNGIFVNDDYIPYHDYTDVLLYDYSSSNKLEIEVTEGCAEGSCEEVSRESLSEEVFEIIYNWRDVN